jgi:hypothetical protein
MATAQTPGAPKKRPAVTIWGIVGVIGLGLWAFGMLYNSGSGRVAPLAAPAAPTGIWYPSGFAPLPEDRTLAYRWMAKGEFACPGGFCWGMMVATSRDCGSLYAELSVLDDSGVVVGYSNALVSGVREGEQAKLVFQSYEAGGRTARISKVTCY